jgi:DNA-binding XRE family transcriptional regulator
MAKLPKGIADIWSACSRCDGHGFLPSAGMRRCRQRAGLQQGEVAGLMGISRAYLSDLERGRRDWDWRLVKKYAAALGLQSATNGTKGKGER